MSWPGVQCFLCGTFNSPWSWEIKHDFSWHWCKCLNMLRKNNVERYLMCYLCAESCTGNLPRQECVISFMADSWKSEHSSAIFFHLFVLNSCDAVTHSFHTASSPQFIIYLFIFGNCLSFIHFMYTNPPNSMFFWEETGKLGVNPRGQYPELRTEHGTPELRF